jgi:hypothetical protein
MDYIYKNKENGKYIISKQWGNVKQEVTSDDISLALKFNTRKKNTLAFYDLVYDDCERISYNEELKNIRKNKLKKINQT